MEHLNNQQRIVLGVLMRGDTLNRVTARVKYKVKDLNAIVNQLRRLGYVMTETVEQVSTYKRLTNYWLSQAPGTMPTLYSDFDTAVTGQGNA